MQPASTRLQRATWSAIKASKPVSRSNQQSWQRNGITRHTCQQYDHRQRTNSIQIRFYSDLKTDTEKKIEDAKHRINETIESRADTVINLPGPAAEETKKPDDETIIHTLPESSSIVYQSDGSGETTAHGTVSDSQSSSENLKSDESDSTNSEPKQDKEQRWKYSSPLPSQLASQYSNVRKQFTHFMDNFSSHIFVASKRINDLTGYSSIERLKRDIEEQEQTVRRARQHVKDTRSLYQEAIATRSDTQREVNDLLHRKHNWSSTDLERFTNLYRSDHANEHSEQKAHSDLLQAEATYEEASTKLSKSILARYHEEQVWSDKIRQMSTWGTWGLMGLNVLLFIVFQILVEPWRRKRLVKGFEEKVQEALKEQTAENEVRTLFHINNAQEKHANEIIPADSAQGRALPQEEVPVAEITQRAAIEQAAENITNTELEAEPDVMQQTVSEDIQIGSHLDTVPVETNAETSLSGTDEAVNLSPPAEQHIPTDYKDLPYELGLQTRKYVDTLTTKFQHVFNDQQQVNITQRELSAKILEGAFFGAVGVVCFFWATGISSGR